MKMNLTAILNEHSHTFGAKDNLGLILWFL